MIGLSRCLDLIDRMLLPIGALALLLVMGIGVAEILGRSLFGTPIRGQIDIIISLMPLVALVALSLNLRHDGHIRMALLLDNLPLRVRHAIESVGMLLSGFIGGALTIGAVEFGQRAYRFSDSTPDLRLPTWPIKYLVAICLGLFATRCLLFAVGHARVAFGADPERECLPHRVGEDVVDD